MTRGWQAELPGVRDGEEWVSGPASCDRSGMAVYLHLVRAPTDPDRSARAPGTLLADRSPHLTMRKAAKAAPDMHREQIAGLLDDGRARTFNAIGVTLYDQEADILYDGPADHALWSLVADGAVEHTMTLPVLFRRKG